MAEPISATAGWADDGDGVFLTTDAGQSWVLILPATIAASQVAAVAFVDSNTGWLVADDTSADGTPSASLFATTDGGKTWSSMELPYQATERISVDRTFIEAFDENHLWIMFREPGGSASDRGTLLRSSNGGVTWTSAPAPIGDPVAFVDQDTGFLAGGVGGDQIFRTADAGATWAIETLPPIFGGEQIRVSLPTFVGSDVAVLPVTVYGDQSVVVFLRSTDGGQTWVGAGTINVGISTDSASVAVLSATSWLAVGREIYRTDDAGTSWNSMTPVLPLGDTLTAVTFTDSGHAWAMDPVGVCLEGKTNCEARTALLATSNAGANWTELSP